MMVIFLTGLVSMILMRTLRADYARYTARDDDDLEALERDVGEESGCAFPPTFPRTVGLILNPAGHSMEHHSIYIIFQVESQQ